MNLVAILVGKGVTNCDYCGSCSSRSDCERNEALIRVERREWSVQFESPVEELWCWVVGRHLEGLRARMALRWSSNLRQGLRFIGKMSNVRKFLRFISYWIKRIECGLRCRESRFSKPFEYNLKCACIESLGSTRQLWINLGQNRNSVLVWPWDSRLTEYEQFGSVQARQNIY